MYKLCLSLPLFLASAAPGPFADLGPGGGCYQSLSSNSAWATHFCVVRNGGQASCGFGYTAELGSATPQSDLDLTDGNEIRGGISFYSDTANELWTDELFPVLNLDEGVVKIAVTDEASCAVLDTGRAICWGGDWGTGRLGLTNQGIVDGYISPPSIQVLESVAGGNITDICLGEIFGCAVLSTGQVRCWGLNYDGNLGSGDWDDYISGVFVIGITDAVGITCGPFSACAWTATGVLKCWGDDSEFQVPDNNDDDDIAPVVAPIPEKVVDAVIGVNTGCAVTEDGKLYCWGLSSGGSLFGSTPTGPPAPTPVLVNIPAKIVKIVMASLHACALTDKGEVYCWGVNSALGLGYHPYDSSMLFIPRKVNQRYFYGQRVVDIAVRSDNWFQMSGSFFSAPFYPSGGTIFLTEDDKLFYTGVKNRLESEPVPVEYCPTARFDCSDQVAKGKKGKKKQQLIIVGAAVVGVMMVGLAVRYRRRHSTGAMGVTPTPTI